MYTIKVEYDVNENENPKEWRESLENWRIKQIYEQTYCSVGDLIESDNLKGVVFQCQETKWALRFFEDISHLVDGPLGLSNIKSITLRVKSTDNGG